MAQTPWSVLFGDVSAEDASVLISKGETCQLSLSLAENDRKPQTTSLS